MMLCLQEMNAMRAEMEVGAAWKETLGYAITLSYADWGSLNNHKTHKGGNFAPWEQRNKGEMASALEFS
uniref:Uncharacterized protein n=1 Tax=Oryza meridionalis TaxID=40149 RepID=A0A0E0FE89_9ORYZ